MCAFAGGSRSGHCSACPGERRHSPGGRARDGPPYTVREMRRLLVLATFLLLLAGIAYIVAKVALVPYAERQAADAIGARLGAPVTVHSSGALSPGIVRGDLGTLQVRAARVQRDGFTVTGFRADVDGASIDVPGLASGDAVLSFSRI